MRTVLYPGSFDPITIGHKAIVERALRLFDKVIIGVGHNSSKPGFLDIDTRMEAIRAAFRGDDRVEVAAYTGLTVDFMRSVGADCLMRGVRGIADFEAERNIADINGLIAGVETVFLVAEPQYSMISSSMVRELIIFGHDASAYLPAGVAETIIKHRL